MGFQQKIRLFATEHNYDYKDLAKALSIDVAVAHNMFYAGIVPDSLSLIKHIAFRMDMTPGYLLGYCDVNDFTPPKSLRQTLQGVASDVNVYIRLDFGQLPFAAKDIPSALYDCLVLNREDEEDGIYLELQAAGGLLDGRV